MSKFVDLTKAIEDAFSMPVCPLCDNGMIAREDEVCVIVAHGALALAHAGCVMEAREDS